MVNDEDMDYLDNEEDNEEDDLGYEDVNDLNMTPERLLYSCIAKIQRSMENPNIQISIEMVLMLTNELETLLIGCNKIRPDDEYMQRIKSYIESDDYKTAKTDLIKNSKLGIFKRQLLYKLVFEPSSINQPLTLKPPAKKNSL